MISVEIVTGPKFSTFAIERGAVLNIIPLNPGGTSQRGVLVACGNASTAKELKAGRYLFQLELPSGESLAKEVDLRQAQTQPVSIELYSTQSPHEWLSWQQLHSDLTREAHRLPEQRVLATYDQAPMGTQDIVGITLATLAFPLDPSSDAASHFRPFVDFVSSGSVPDHVHLLPIDHGIKNHDQQFALYRWFRDQAPEIGFENKRPFVLVDHATGLRELLALPIPWNRDHNQCAIEVLLSRHPSLSGPRAKLSVLDPVIGTMLTYLSRDMIEATQPFVNDILNAQHWEEILYFKRMNPLAAAGAGYVLLQTDAGPSPKKWHPWIENLCQWFPWLSDGAILQALLHMAQRTPQDGSSKVIASIDLAMNRGLPFYRHGLLRLYDLVSTFHEAAHQPDDVRQRMSGYQRILVPLLQAVNRTEPFVSLRSLAYRRP